MRGIDQNEVTWRRVMIRWSRTKEVMSHVTCGNIVGKGPGILTGWRIQLTIRGSSKRVRAAAFGHPMPLGHILDSLYFTAAFASQSHTSLLVIWLGQSNIGV